MILTHADYERMYTRAFLGLVRWSFLVPYLADTYLASDRVEGEDPLAPFGPNAARHLRRADGFEHVADIMVNSTYYADMDEVAAFEELVGSHGGMGGSQSFPFVVIPAGWRLPEQAIVGPDHMHRYMRRWLANLGHEPYRDSVA